VSTETVYKTVQRFTNGRGEEFWFEVRFYPDRLSPTATRAMKSKSIPKIATAANGAVEIWQCSKPSPAHPYNP